VELFSIPCTTCGARLKVKSLSALGQIFNCPKCQSMVLVEAPPGWKPPSKPSTLCRAPASPAQQVHPAAAARQAAASVIPEALETPVAALAESGAAEPAIPVAVPWQSRAEARWRRWSILGGAAIGSVLAIAAVVAWWPESAPEAALVQEEPPPAPVPVEPPPAPASEPPAERVAEPGTTKDRPPIAPPALASRPWLPANPRLVLSLPLSRLAEHEVAPEVLASGSSPLRQALSDLRVTFHLLPEQIRRLTWAAAEDTADMRGSLVVIELSQPLADDAALLAGCQKTDLRVADAVCHQPPDGGWPHPFAVVDPSTIVTGPAELLSSASIAGEASLEHPAFAATLVPPSADTCRLTIDLRRWKALDKLQWPAAIEELFARDSWRLLKDLPEAVSLTIDLATKATVDLQFYCHAPEVAAETKQAVEDASRDWQGVQISLEGNVVTCRLEWLDDSRLLAAALLASLPAWPAPPAAVVANIEPPEAIAATPAPAPPHPSPFERQVARSLDERIPAITLRGMKLADFAAFISRLGGVTIAIDEAALELAGLPDSLTIEVQLTSATIGEVLSAALSAHELDYVAEQNRLLITTRAKAKSSRSP
jgi:hypothetical protein